MKRTTDSNVSFRPSDDFVEQDRAALNAPSQPEPFSRVASSEARSDASSINSNLSVRKPDGHRRRYQLHLWINEREYTLLKSLAESQEEPMSRIVRRLFSHLRHLVDRGDRKAS